MSGPSDNPAPDPELNEAPTVDSPAPTTAHDPLADVPGGVIGPYRILQLIGEGGFGRVFMAYQSHPVKRKVALKIIKPGMDSKQVIGRFESERQALAMMDHPNIARVLDAGTTDHGRPYFVMELVRGIAITQYCDSANLEPVERLELFITVCQAIQHAHNKGIVHRDLKPGNVLVTLHDDKPVVKVIDFGIAKAMNHDLGEGTVFTEFRQFMGTPEYMAPEQAAMSALDVDTRADIYSLGVLLYELLTGSTPFEAAELRNTPFEELQRIMREVEPPRPSTRLSKLAAQDHKAHTRTTAEPSGSGSTPAPDAKTKLAPSTGRAESVARHRRTDVRSLSRFLRGDLDWIVMKCLEKDRTRRYETAAALAEDIRRHLRCDPIIARPPTTAYRVRKFARRNRLAIGAATGVLCALLLTLAALTYGLIQVRHERDKTAERETITRAEILLTAMNSVRKYTTDSVRPALVSALHAAQAQARVATPSTAPAPTEPAAPKTGYKDEAFAREMVPGFGARQVFARFRANDLYKAFVYKEAAPNPTNKDNLADEFENSLVHQFQQSPDVKELTGIRDMLGVPNFYMARPMRVGEASCLDCHTTPEMAPPQQVSLYGRDSGYGWKLNDVVAAQIVYVPVSEAFRSDHSSGVKYLALGAGVLILVSGAGLLLLRRI